MPTISLPMWKNDLILELLRADKGEDDERLLCQIMVRVTISREIADAYLRSFRFNNKQGAIGAISKAVDAEKGTKKIKTNEQPVLDPVQNRILTDDHEEIIVEQLPLLEGEGKVAAILRLHDSGLSNDQIISQGFNKSTVYRQVSEYKTRKKAAKDAKDKAALQGA